MNTIAALGGSHLTITPEFTYSLIALLAGITTFVMTKVNVNFAFYFFVINRAANGSSEAQEINPKGHSFKLNSLIKLLYLTFLAPVFITLMFVHELSGKILVENVGIT